MDSSSNDISSSLEAYSPPRKLSRRGAVIGQEGMYVPIFDLEAAESELEDSDDEALARDIVDLTALPDEDDPVDDPMDESSSDEPIDAGLEIAEAQPAYRQPDQQGVAPLDANAQPAPLDDMDPEVNEFVRPPPRGRFRMNAQKFFLTYPRCDVAPADAIATIKELLEEPYGIKFVVCGREKHADGSLHLHIALWLRKPLDIRSAKYWDFVTAQHGHYRIMCKPERCVAYVIKEGDVEFFSSEPGWTPSTYVESRKRKKPVAFLDVALQVKEGLDLDQINELHPGFMLQNLSRVVAYMDWMGSRDLARRLPYPQVGLTAALAGIGPAMSLEEMQILGWMDMNFGRRRTFKQAQLYIHGRGDVGKTSLVLAIEEAFAKVYWVPMDEEYYTLYDDKQHTLSVFDEFRGQKTIQWMNSWAQGAPLSIKRKNGQGIKRQNIPTIVLSNYEPAGAYHKVAIENPTVLETFVARFTVIAIPEGGNLFKLIDAIRRYKEVVDRQQEEEEN